MDGRIKLDENYIIVDKGMKNGIAIDQYSQQKQNQKST